MIRAIIFIGSIMMLFAVSSVNGQSWRQLVRDAKNFEATGNYGAAAKAYEDAYQQKSNKKNLIYAAGEAYLTVGDYKGAERTLGQVQSNDDFPLAGLKYGRAVKAQGRYREARSAFSTFVKTYSAPDKKVVQALVKNEIAGCAIAERHPALSDNTDGLFRLGDAINSPSDDFAPIPFSSGILYFVSARSGKASIFRSRLESGQWTTAVEPKLPAVTGHVSQGSFSADGKRFYFTLCSDAQGWRGIKSKCDIYITQKRDSKWSTPARLREYLKMDGTTAMNPCVVQKGGTEVLYFVSDRPDGYGGLDIWYTTREADSEAFDFTFPKNLGPKINTLGDELTPFFDAGKEQLFFSSNGHPTIGGFDVFSSKGSTDNWQSPTHLKAPINSSADDFGYIFPPADEVAFLVSNRSFGTAKENTTDTYIYTFGSEEIPMTISGTIRNAAGTSRSYSISLYELNAQKQQRLLTTKTFTNPDFELSLLPQRNLRLVINQSGAAPTTYDFNTLDPNQKQYKKDFQIGTTSTVTSTTRPTTSRPSTSTTTTRPTTSRPTTTATTSTVNNRPPNNQIFSGTYYKVQLTVVVTFDEESNEFDSVRTMGNIDTEYLPEQKWTRILLSPFFTLKEAREVMAKARNLGYPDAFPVRYKNGTRMTP